MAGTGSTSRSVNRGSSGMSYDQLLELVQNSDLINMSYSDLVMQLQSDLQPLGIDGAPVDSSQPAVGDALTWTGDAWAPNSSELDEMVSSTNATPSATGWQLASGYTVKSGSNISSGVWVSPATGLYRVTHQALMTTGSTVQAAIGVFIGTSYTAGTAATKELANIDPMPTVWLGGGSVTVSISKGTKVYPLVYSGTASVIVYGNGAAATYFQVEAAG